MANHQTSAISDAVHKIQLALLEGITEQKQLLAAGSLMSCSDYEDVVTERTIGNLCGYPLCRNPLSPAPSRRGRYRISLKEHKVYDLQEARKFCSSDCLISSRAYSGTLLEVPCSVLNPEKLNEILSLFLDSGVEESLGVNKDMGLSKLRIHEDVEPKVSEMSLEEWMGPSNAIEGYVPLNNCNFKTSNSRYCKQDSEVAHNKQQCSNEGFISTVSTYDEYSVSKLPSRTKEAAIGGRTEKPQEKGVAKCLEHEDAERASIPPKEKESCSFGDSNKSRSKKSFEFNETDFTSTILLTDEYTVSKLAPCSTEFTFDGQPEEAKGQGNPINEHQTSLLGLSSAPRKKGSSKKWKDSKRKVKFVEKNKSMTKVPQASCQDGGKTQTAEACWGTSEDACFSRETTLKSSLKPSGSKKLNHSVTWADKGAVSDSCGNLCEVRNIEDTEADLGTLSFVDEDDGNRASRFASAEACARALSDAAESVAFSDVKCAVFEAGLVLLPKPDREGGEVSREEVEEETPESEPTLLEWPNKPGVPDSDIFDSNQSWFDEPPEGFNLTLSNFATMWNALFGWVTSSSLAYIYGKDEDEHEAYLVVNGREYPRKIILGDGRSSEIKETLAGCLARALPGIVADLSLPMPISELEKGLGSMLETMTLTEAVPGLRMKQWQVMVLVFIEALSVCRIPLLTPYVSNRRRLHQKVLEGAGIGVEEYETMKEIVTPLGRAPDLSAQSGA